MAIKYKNELQLASKALKSIGYSSDLICKSYEYAVLSETAYTTRQVPLVAFAQRPPSYRNSCIAVICSNGRCGAENVILHRDIGAPILLELSNNKAVQWWLDSNGKPKFIKDCRIDQISGFINQHKKFWSPEAILRAKGIKEPFADCLQEDFFDSGFFPQLQTLARGKLDILLRDALKKTAFAYESSKGKTINPKSLFRLVFRFVAAKTLQDRKHPGRWNSSDPQEILDAVEDYYATPDDSLHSYAITDRTTLETAWKAISTSLHFQNLSSHDLAFVYENTLISPETRKLYGTHSTPTKIAEFILARMPIEEIPLNRRFIVEPCSGHGAFLLAAMQRLRDLLPADFSDNKRHQYLQKRLIGLELDAFSVEICRLALILADYPNKNNWRIKNVDVFENEYLSNELSNADCVLCNPPYEDFRSKERLRYSLRSVHKPAEILHRILDKPPAMLGFVLPRSFAMGRAYKQLQLDIARSYAQVELVALPDKVFQHSDAETVLLLAHERKKHNRFVQIACREITDGTRRKFLDENWVPSGQTSMKNLEETGVENKSFSLWIPRLSRVWRALSDFHRLGEYADIHRGVEYNIPISAKNAAANRAKVFSSAPKNGFKAGLEKAEGALTQYSILKKTYMRIAPQLMRGRSYRLPWQEPKILVNAARKSRGPWRLVAAIDSKGLLAYQRLHAVWPKSHEYIYPLLAILNSPIANAFAYSKEGNRDNRISTLKDIPTPDLHAMDSRALNLAVQGLLKCVSVSRKSIQIDDANLRDLLLCVDAELLRLYDLPPVLERELLEVFQGYRRPGLIYFEGYYPQGFEAYLPLHRLVSKEFELASADNILRTLKPIDDKVIHQALGLASWGEV